MSADQKTDVTNHVLAQPTGGQEVISLDQWATEVSGTDARVEMLNGFVSVERAASRFSATRNAWTQAYFNFANRAV